MQEGHDGAQAGQGVFVEPRDDHRYRQIADQALQSAAGQDAVLDIDAEARAQVLG